MNGKKAKELRKTAKLQTVGMPEKEYETIRHYLDRKVLKKTCTRYVYQKLKKSYKN